MKTFLKILTLSFASLFFVISSANSATVLFPSGGGTGIGSALVGDIAKCLVVSNNAPFTYALSACGSGGGSSGGTWSTTTSQVSGRLINYPNNATDIVTIGSSSTTTAPFWFDPNTNTFSQGGWNVGTTTTMVCKNSNQCKYSSIQTALTDGWTSLYVKNGTYSEQITVTNAKTKIEGESLNAIIQCNGATQSPCIDVQADEFVMKGMSVREVNAKTLGIGIDLSNVSLAIIEGNRFSNFSTSTTLTDTSSLTFYNRIENNTFFNPKTGIELSGTQANANWISKNRIRPVAVDGGYGIYLVDARGITLDSNDTEGTTTVETNTGIYVGPTSREITITNPWVEALGTGISIDSGANRVTVVGGSITSNGTDITDNGTDTTFLNTSDTGVLVNKFSPFTVPSLTGTSTITNALQIGGSTGVTSYDNSTFLVNSTLDPNLNTTFYSNYDGAVRQEGLVNIRVDNTTWDGPVLRIVSDSTDSEGTIRLDSPTPEIEYVESDQVSPAGKFETRVQNDVFQINGRASDDSGFENAFAFLRLADGGGFGLLDETPDARLEVVATSTDRQPMFGLTGSGANDGLLFNTWSDGYTAIGWNGASVAKLQLNSNAVSPSSIDLTNTIAVGTGRSGANATSKFLGQFGWLSRDSSFTVPKIVAYISGEATETYGADTDVGSLLRFYTGTIDGTSPTEKAVLTDTGNFGIGTSTPYAKLSVVGDVVATNFFATSTTASSTFANGINITGGCFAKNGICLTSGSGSSASTTLLADVNTFSGATTTFSNDINVGRYLHVGTPHDSQIEQDMASFIGDADDFRSVTLRNTNSGADASIDLLFNNDASTDTENYADCGMNSSNYNVPAYGFQNVPNLWYCYTSTGAMSFSSATYIQFLVNGFDSEAIRFTQNGRISIGSTTPNSKLTITNASSDPTLWIESEENDTTPTVLTNSDRLGIATSSPWTTLSVNGIAGLDSLYATDANATSTFKGKVDANRITSATLRLTGLTSCTEALETDPYGNVICGTDVAGAGGAVTGNGIAGMMASWNSTSNLIATSTIIGERVYATSTTATSTFLGSLAVGGATPDATFSVKGIGGKVAQFFTSAGTKLIDIANDGIITFLGVLNAGDATSLEIPNATSPTYGAGGILALDTTANNLTLATSTVGHQVVWSATTTLYSFSMASTSPYFVSGATKMLPSKSLQQVVTTIWCKVDGGTSKIINLTDGTNDTNSVTCTTTGSEHPITTNATFTPAEAINLEMGATSGTVNDLIIDIKGYRVSN